MNQDQDVSDLIFISAPPYTRTTQSVHTIRKSKSSNMKMWPDFPLLLPSAPLLDLEHDDRAGPDVVVGQRVGVLQEERLQLQLLLARRHPGLLVQPRLN